MCLVDLFGSFAKRVCIRFEFLLEIGKFVHHLNCSSLIFFGEFVEMHGFMKITMFFALIWLRHLLVGT